MLINLLNNLIEKKFYEEKEEIQNKLDVFYAMNKINDEEYTSLTLKVEEKYKVEEIVQETETEEKTTDTVESEG